MKKSYFISFVLTLLIGPLGLFYSSIAAAVAFLISGIIFGAITLGWALIVIWPASIITGFFTVHRFNSKVVLEKQRHQELLEATRGSENKS